MNTTKLGFMLSALFAVGVAHADQAAITGDVLSWTADQWQQSGQLMSDSESSGGRVVIYDSTPKTRAQVNEELRQAAAQGEVPVDIEHAPERFLAQTLEPSGQPEQTSTGQ